MARTNLASRLPADEYERLKIISGQAQHSHNLADTGFRMACMFISPEERYEYECLLEHYEMAKAKMLRAVNRSLDRKRPPTRTTLLA